MKRNNIVIFNILFISFLVLIVNVYAYPSGDVDGNGKVGSSDYVLVRKHILKQTTLTGDKLKRADVNSDGKITSMDYVSIRKIILGGGSSTPTPTPTITPTITPTVTPTLKPSSNYIELYFLNTMNNPVFEKTYTTNDSFIIKTSNNKYILLDTGVATPTDDSGKRGEIKSLIYNKLKELQNKDKVTIDYMIISHMHSDHVGNAKEIINDSNITIKNIILKSESISKFDEKVIDAAKTKKINIIDTNVVNYKDGTSYNISNNVNMYLFNVKDVYTSSDDCSTKGYFLIFTSDNSAKNTEYAKDVNGKYIYFNGQDYIDSVNKSKEIKLYTDDKPKQIIGDNETLEERMNKKFYAVLTTSKPRPSCSSNANSIAIIFQVKTSEGNKYIYLPSDLENTGYNPLGEYDSEEKVMIHGYAPAFSPKYTTVDGEVRIVLEDGKLVHNPKVPEIKNASEYLTAKKIVNTFSDIKNNLVIYQESHHALNNEGEALKTLNINRKGVYTIVPSGGNPKAAKNIRQLKTQYFLMNTNIMVIAAKDKKGIANNGIKCVINSSSKTSCAYY